MLEEVAQTKLAFTEGLQKAATLQDLEQSHIKYFARMGEIAVMVEGMKSASSRVQTQAYGRLASS